MKVTIIGAAGKMGQWFTNYFIEKDFEIIIYDIDSQKLQNNIEKNVTIADNIISATQEADIILISIPIHLTAKMVLDISELVKDDCIIIEIASFKEEIINYCKKSIRNNVNYLSIHPMFGPGAKNLTNAKMISVTVNDTKREVTETKNIFPEANVISTSAKEHDESMSIILSFTQFINFAYASVLSVNNLKKIRKLSGTSFNLQLTIAEAILHDDPEFLATLQIENKYVIQQINKFVNESNDILDLISKKDHIKLSVKLRKLKMDMEKDSGYDTAYSKMYEIINASLEKKD